MIKQALRDDDEDSITCVFLQYEMVYMGSNYV